MHTTKAMLLALAAGWTEAQLPQMAQSWQMSRSTIIMPCNYSGFTDTASTAGLS